MVQAGLAVIDVPGLLLDVDSIVCILIEEVGVESLPFLEVGGGSLLAVVVNDMPLLVADVDIGGPSAGVVDAVTLSVEVDVGCLSPVEVDVELVSAFEVHVESLPAVEVGAKSLPTADVVG